MVHNRHCDICNDTVVQTYKNNNGQKDDISFAALLALVPVMTLTVFSLIGLI